MEIKSNIVKGDKLREVQGATLQLLEDVLVNSYGPHGSNTVIHKKSKAVEYTKDGDSILGGVELLYPIENSVLQNVRDITKDTVKKVGDGTTSAVILSNAIFKTVTENITKLGDRTPFDVIRDMERIVKNVCDKIETHKRDVTLEEIKKICLVATNGNTKIANDITSIYERFGLDAYIDVSISPKEHDIIKIYDGLTLGSGMADSAFVNQADNTTCEIRDAHIYQFDDPIDTVELVTLFDAIIGENLFRPASEQRYQDIKPTVILAPKLSRDMSAYMEQFVAQLNTTPNVDKFPFLLVTNIHEAAKFADIGKLCGCRPIKKYIDSKQQEIDVAKGLAATPETVIDFDGRCEMVSSTNDNTKFVNPILMKDEEGNPTQTYTSLLYYLEAELQREINEGTSINSIGELKRRIQSLKANMVEFLVGGITVADRDAVRHLVEDAILSCRSASQYGYGYASNFEGYRAINEVIADADEADVPILEMLSEGYEKIISLLYKVSGVKDIKPKDVLTVGKPYDVKKKEFSENIIGSIKADVSVLTAVSRIITLMITSNQFLFDGINEIYK